LQIDKKWIDERRIPSDVVARVLPKTLFGEKYVELVVPPGTASAAAALQTGDVISRGPQLDRDRAAEGLHDLVPLLRTLKPEELSVALSNLAGALRGRGNELGQNLVLLDKYFSKFNTDLPNFNHDISALRRPCQPTTPTHADLLARCATRYQRADVQPEAGCVRAVSSPARRASRVRRRPCSATNANRLITLAKVSNRCSTCTRPTPTSSSACPTGLAIYDRTRLEQVFDSGPFLHITRRRSVTAARTRRATSRWYSDLINDKPSEQRQQLLRPPVQRHSLHSVDAGLFAFPGPHPTATTRLRVREQPGLSHLPSGTANTHPVAAHNVVSPAAAPSSRSCRACSHRSSDRALTPDWKTSLLGPMLRGMNVTVTR